MEGNNNVPINCAFHGGRYQEGRSETLSGTNRAGQDSGNPQSGSRMNTNHPRWIDWAREIFSMSQAGLTYSKNEFDIERYKRLQEITAEMIASETDRKSVV